MRAGRLGDTRVARGNPATMMLRMRSELQLTEDQVKALEALQAAPAPRANEAEVLRARADLLEATQGDGNLSKARAALARLSGLRNERMIAGLKQRQEARAVLTAEQKTRLDNWRGQRRGRELRGGQGARGFGVGRPDRD
jgi:Spy/CpxP family protein refolding chaperone